MPSPTDQSYRPHWPTLTNTAVCWLTELTEVHRSAAQWINYFSLPPSFRTLCLILLPFDSFERRSNLVHPRAGNDNHKESNNNLQLSPSANNLHLHVHNQLSGSSLNTDNSSASYSSTLDLHHKVNMSLEHFSNPNHFIPRKTPPGMLQNLFKNLRQKSKYCFLTNLKQANQAFMRKVPHGAEADNILGKHSFANYSKRSTNRLISLFLCPHSWRSWLSRTPYIDIHTP